MSWLIFPASVKSIALQLPSNLLVVLRTTALSSFQNITGLTLAPAFLASPETLVLSLFALLETLQHTGQLWFFERCVLRDARHVDPLIVIFFRFVVFNVIPIVVDIVMVVDVVVLSCISAVVPFVVV